MMKLIAGCLLLSLLACSDEYEESYASFAEAEKAGAIKRGWVPAFVPESARDIRESHNLDTNAQTLQFTISPSDVKTMVTGLHSMTAEDEVAVTELRLELGVKGQTADYIVCSEPLNGALLVNAETGQTAYRTPAPWVNNNCL